MTANLSSQSLAEFTADKAAVSATNFCTLWPAGKAALQALSGVVSNALVKFAINTVISAGDAYCGGSAQLADTADAAMSSEENTMTADTWIVHSDVIITNN